MRIPEDPRIAAGPQVAPEMDCPICGATIEVTGPEVECSEPDCDFFSEPDYESMV